MSGRIQPYEDLIIHITPDKFYIEPVEKIGAEILVIDRVSRQIVVTGTANIPENATSRAVCAILGIIKLLAGPYLIVITKKMNVGELNGHTVWRVVATDIIPYSRTELHLTEKQAQDNRAYVSMLQQVLQMEYFYFSYTYDLSYTAQRLYNSPPEFLQIPLHVRADHRFVWNKHAMNELAAKPECSRYCLPVILGFISIKTCHINNKTIKWVLLSRRSTQRAGTRLFVRGLNTDGYAANFVETEQIVQYDGDMCSFVQTRGSIPLFWTQKPDLRLKPKPALTPSQNHIDAFVKHFYNQLELYGRQVIVNLIDHKGAEYKLERALADTVATVNNPNIRYESFDFHHECSKMRYDRLSILMDRTSRESEEFGYFMLLRDGAVPSQQEGVFRTNCVDCLDRTNVVQSMLARRCLQNQLQRLGILLEGQRVEDQDEFESTYKNIWADHADICSVQYAGAPALKTDYTRTGKRTRKGMLKDGWNSLLRYYKNNFADGFRQDAIDLFLGQYVVDEGEGVARPSVLQQDRDLRFFILPLIFLVAIAMSCLTLMIPTELSLETMIYFLFWISMSVMGLLVILHFGVEFVDHPRLCADLKRKKE